jgi:hypothetical protein
MSVQNFGAKVWSAKSFKKNLNYKQKRKQETNMKESKKKKRNMKQETRVNARNKS